MLLETFTHSRNCKKNDSSMIIIHTVLWSSTLSQEDYWIAFRHLFTDVIKRE